MVTTRTRKRTWSKERRKAHEQQRVETAEQLLRFARQVSLSRARTGLTITEAARYIGISPSTWRSWENAEADATVGTVCRAACLLDESLDWLLAGRVNDSITRKSKINRGLLCLCERDNLTESQAAKRAGVSMDQWNAWRGEKRLMNNADAAKVAAAFNVPPEYFLGWPDKPRKRRTWGKRLEEFRTRKQLTVQQAAQAVGVRPALWQQWEAELTTWPNGEQMRELRKAGADLTSIFQGVQLAETTTA